LERQRIERERQGTHFCFGDEIFFPAHMCLPERRLVVAAGLESDLDGFRKTLVDRGWLETASGH